MPGRAPSSPNLVEVKFKKRRREIFHNNRGFDLMAGDAVVVGVDRGMDLGYVTMTGELAALLRTTPKHRYSNVIRVATEKDEDRHKENRTAEIEVLKVFRTLLKRRKIRVKPVDAEWQFDRKRLRLYYSYSGSGKPRINSKVVIRDLGRQFKTRVELEFVTPRNETARMGGIGVCGRELCCSSWMRSVPIVLMSAARKQHLPLSDDRLRGRCNRLKCCLNYELDHYMETLREFPAVGAKIRTESGSAKVKGVDIFARTLQVRYIDGPFETISLEDLRSSRS